MGFTDLYRGIENEFASVSFICILMTHASLTLAKAVELLMKGGV